MNDQPAIFGKGRVEALSDGLFAIVLTLLVLDLRVPELEKGVDPRALLEALGKLWPTLFAFVLTFALASSFWLLHHQLFHTVRFVTRVVLLLNLLFLLFVSLLPFTTGLVGHYFMHQPIVLRIYFVNQVAIGLSLWSVWWACRRADMLDDKPGTQAFAFQVRVLIIAGAALVAAVWTYVAPRMTFHVFAFGIIFARLLERRLRKRARPSPE